MPCIYAAIAYSAYTDALLGLHGQKYYFGFTSMCTYYYFMSAIKDNVWRPFNQPSCAMYFYRYLKG